MLFEHPHTLLDRVGKVLGRVGPEKFFSSSEQEVKKAQEGFFAYFFTLVLKKHYHGRDWWIYHPNQSERKYPDFDFVSFGDDIKDLKLEPVELTGVYPHFKSFEEALSVVKNKQKKYGDKLLNFSLLVFVNHEKSEEWINQLRSSIMSEKPFLSIWAIHLRFKIGGKEVDEVVAQKIMPLPYLRIETKIDDSEIHKPQGLPRYFEVKKDGENTYITLKASVFDEIKKTLNNN
jgi:hypothetical protein